jgi:hypothetical protein
VTAKVIYSEVAVELKLEEAQSPNRSVSVTLTIDAIDESTSIASIVVSTKQLELLRQLWKESYNYVDWEASSSYFVLLSCSIFEKLIKMEVFGLKTHQLIHPRLQ